MESLGLRRVEVCSGEGRLCLVEIIDSVEHLLIVHTFHWLDLITLELVCYCGWACLELSLGMFLLLCFVLNCYLLRSGERLILKLLIHGELLLIDDILPFLSVFRGKSLIHQ